MPKKTEDQIAVEVIREVERRVVWMGSFLVLRAMSHGGAEIIAKASDEALAAYERRFPPIGPEGL